MDKISALTICRYPQYIGQWLCRSHRDGVYVCLGQMWSKNSIFSRLVSVERLLNFHITHWCIFSQVNFYNARSPVAGKYPKNVTVGYSCRKMDQQQISNDSIETAASWRKIFTGLFISSVILERWWFLDIEHVE